MSCSKNIVKPYAPCSKQREITPKELDQIKRARINVIKTGRTIKK